MMLLEHLYVDFRVYFFENLIDYDGIKTIFVIYISLIPFSPFWTNVC